MRGLQVILAVGMLAMLTLAGCGQKVRQGMEVARVARDAQDGKFTVKGEEGQEVQVDTTQGEGSWKMTETDASGKKVTAEYGATAVKEEDIGVAFYPGAEVESGMTVASSDKESNDTASVILKTTDSFDAVAKFYKDKYAEGNTVVEQPNMLMITIKTGEGKGKMIMASPNGDSGTQIVIHNAADM